MLDLRSDFLTFLASASFLSSQPSVEFVSVVDVDFSFRWFSHSWNTLDIDSAFAVCRVDIELYVKDRGLSLEIRVVLAVP